MRPVTFTLSITLALLIAVGAFLLYETRNLAELAGKSEVAARAARADATRIAADRGRESERRAAAAGEIARLERELARTAAQLDAMADTVREAKEGAVRRVDEARSASLRALAAMPEGVRQCLDALHRGLLAEGYSTVRFLRAESLDEDGLHGVELIQTHADGLGADLIIAGTMRATLVRTDRRLLLSFFDGTRSEAGELVELPEAGWNIVFQPVDGRLLEQNLPYLLDAEGAYPIALDQAAHVALPSDVDLTTRMIWLERFDRLLESAGTSEEIRVQRFRGIADGRFLDAELLATDNKGRVEFGVTCKQLAVEIDRTARVVSLLLRDGVLCRGRAESTITDVGYRMLLPDVTPEAAIETMLGLVVNR